MSANLCSDSNYRWPWLRIMILVALWPVSWFVQCYNWLLQWISPAPLRWQWDNAGNPNRQRLDLWSDLHFPRSFLWGTATAAHQIEGQCTNNNWYRWETSKDPRTGRPRISRGQKSGQAADHWNRVKEDVQLMKDLGCNAYRFSIEWSKVEPKNGQWNAQAIQHYRDEIDLLIKNGITPMVTLHHFSQPLWFDDLGGWERELNIEHFIRFSEHVYTEFSDKVPLWCTLNEPTVFSMVGWLQGSFPPGKRDAPIWENIRDAVNVLRNLLVAHVRVYHHLKAINDGPKIGLVHNVFQMRPYRRWNPFDYLSAMVADQLQNELVIQFLRTGLFKFSLPVVKVRFNFKMSEAVSSFDFIGLNYYSHYHMKAVWSLTDPIRQEAPPEESQMAVMTDMEYPLYAEGFYSALMRLSKTLPGVPIYVTENGIADVDDSRRQMFLQRYLYALSRAVQDGCDVRGYFYWTLMDNFEWAFGFDQRFGLYEVDLGVNGDGIGATHRRTLRKGSEYFCEVVKRFTVDQADDDEEDGDVDS